MPVDIYLVEYLSGLGIEEKGAIGRLVRKIYKRRDRRGVKFKSGKLISAIIYPEFFSINKEEAVLNVGCGDGVQAVIYKDNFKKMIGIDISKERLGRARQLMEQEGINNAEFIEANVENMPLSEKFDKAIAIDIIEHVVNPDRLVREIHRLLKDDGSLLVTFPATHDKWTGLFRFIGRKILRRRGKTVRKRGWDPDAHQYDYKLKKWISLVEKEGFKLIDSRGSTLFPPLHYLGIPKFWFTNRFVHKIDNFFCKLPKIKNCGSALVCVFRKSLIDTN